MNPQPIEPYEIKFAETTDEEYRDAVLHGGWVEYHLSCPLCDLHEVHRHYICSLCGMIDFANKTTCFECRRISEAFRIRRDIMNFVREHGATMARLGVKFVIILALITIATWRIA